jgi:hypothetical protein
MLLYWCDKRFQEVAKSLTMILRGKISSFTVDRLLGYTQKIYPDFKFEILAA